MSDQPTIIEDPQSQKDINQGSLASDSSIFFQLLDVVEEYDSIAQQIKMKYEQAMLQLANIKFLNPYILTPNSHRCLPAYVKISPQGSLQQGYSSFTQQIDQDQFPDQFQEQEIIESDCLKKGEVFERGLHEKKYNHLRNGEVLYRFNILNQQKEVISASNKFYGALESILKLSKARERLQANFKRIQSLKNKENSYSE